VFENTQVFKLDKKEINIDFFFRINSKPQERDRNELPVKTE
jgi:hypothetical protein